MSSAMELPPAGDRSSRSEAERSFLRLLFTTPLAQLLRGRVTGPVPRMIRTQIAQANLPASLHVFVQDVVKHTRLWNSEKREIARELAAHFADGLESGRSADQLISDFGDGGRAALLIRRAAKRNRPWPWQAARFTLLGMLACIGLGIAIYGVLSLRFYFAQPGPMVDLRPALNAQALAVADADRAWPLYREALLRVKDNHAIENELFQQRDFLRMPHPGEEGWDVVAEHLDRWQPALAYARQAADKPGLGLIVGYEWSEADQALWPTDNRQPEDPMSAQSLGLVGVLLPHLGSMRRLALILGWDTERAVAEGDGATALANMRSVLAIARHLRETPTLINALVSVSAMTMACQKINWALDEHPQAFNDDQLIALAHELAAMSDREMDLDFSGERQFFQDVIQRIYSDDGRGDGRITPGGLEWLESMTNVAGTTSGQDFFDFMMEYGGPVVSAVMLSRAEMTAEHDRLMRIIETDAATPLWLRDESQAERLVEEWHGDTYERMKRYPLTLLLPALSRASANTELSMMHRDATLTVIALELYRRRNGAWPDSLEALVPHLMPSLPIDRFDGQPLRYTLQDGQPLLYSVGTDREDDGGTPVAYGVGHGGQMWYPRDRTAELLRNQKPVIGANGQKILYYDGDWILWPPIDEGPVRRDDPATDE